MRMCHTSAQDDLRLTKDIVSEANACSHVCARDHVTCSRQRPAFPRHVHMPGNYVGPSKGTSACLWSFLEGDTCLSLLIKKLRWEWFA